ncbi:polyhydroxyalkanoic acid system family protein [Pollutibacter soli]|uniref:polyhydroxyalkanoic acid system family protein n=1 Tax=Pollutibacter soli TaxID=3034157 RepID=UPI0030136B9B
MSTLNVKIPHELSKEEALERIKNMLSGLKEQQKDKINNLKENWDGSKGSFSFSVMGFDLAGDVNVSDKDVEINSKLPFAVSFFKSTIEEMIAKEAQKLLR